MQCPVAGEKPFRVGVAFLFAKSAGFHHLAKNPVLHDRDALAAGFQKADVVGDHENGNSFTEALRSSITHIVSTDMYP